MITRKELSEIKMLNYELKIDRQRLAALRRASLTPTFDPHHIRSTDPADPTARIAGALCELEGQILRKSERCVALLLKLQRFIDSVDDSEQRSIFYLKYVKQFSWQRIALELGCADEQLPRKRHHKYLREHGIK